MAKQYPDINDELKSFITEQKIFFVATADKDGRVNLSPKGADTIRVLNNKRIAWLNLTGSGNETAAHILANNRITIMFCSFDETPVILRIYGRAKIIHPHDKNWSEFSDTFSARTGARQIFDVEVELVQTSCGFQVPYFEYKGERDTLEKWENKRGASGIRQYWQEKNRISLDGKPTDI